MSDKLARRPPAKPKKFGKLTPAERFAVVIDLMLRKEWKPGTTAPALAAEWGVTLSVVERDASEAKKLLAYVKEPELVRDAVVAGCVAIWKEGAPDRVQALRLAAEVTGNLKQRHEVTLAQKPMPELVADALQDAEFRACIEARFLAEGWRRPETIETTGQEVTEP